MRLDKDMLALCLDVYEERLAVDEHLPIDARRREARAAAERVLCAYAPGAVALIEKRRERTVVDELRARGLRKRAQATIDAVLRDANVEGDVTEKMLFHSAIPWVVGWRDRLCWQLSLETLMSTRDIAVVLGRSKHHQGVVKAIHRHEAWRRARLNQKEATNGA